MISGEALEASSLLNQGLKKQNQQSPGSWLKAQSSILSTLCEYAPRKGARGTEAARCIRAGRGNQVADAFLKISVALSLLGAAGVGYYHFAQLTRRAETEARLSEAQSREERSAAGKAAIQDRYQTCVNVADLAYNSNWALNCEKLAEKQIELRSDCLAGGLLRKELCEALHPLPTGRKCSLPHLIGSDLDSERNRAREMCLRESEAGLQ
jgi:hypothetical protein